LTGIANVNKMRLFNIKLVFIEIFISDNERSFTQAGIPSTKPSAKQSSPKLLLFIDSKSKDHACREADVSASTSAQVKSGFSIKFA